MNIDVTSRGFTISKDLNEFIHSKLEKISTFDNTIFAVKVVLLKESRAEKVELIVESKKKTYISKRYSSVFEKTIVKAIDNIKKEFLDYGYPTWFRDLVGVLKISFCVMIHSSSIDVVVIGSIGISILMIGAVITHLKMKSTFRKYIASVAMLAIAGFILLFTM